MLTYLKRNDAGLRGVGLRRVVSFTLQQSGRSSRLFRDVLSRSVRRYFPVGPLTTRILVSGLFAQFTQYSCKPFSISEMAFDLRRGDHAWLELQSFVMSPSRSLPVARTYRFDMSFPSVVQPTRGTANRCKKGLALRGDRSCHGGHLVL